MAEPRKLTRGQVTASEAKRTARRKSAKDINRQAERIIGRLYWSNRGEENPIATNRIRKVNEIAGRYIKNALAAAEKSGIKNYEDSYTFGVPHSQYMRRRKNRG